MSRAVLLPLFALALAGPARAQPRFQDIDALERRLIAALGAGIGEPGGPATTIDRRLKLAACPATVAIEPPALGAVALRCTALNWRIRVPIQRLAGIDRAARADAAGADPVIRRGDLVELVAGTASFVVSTQATADADGAPGDRIRLKPQGKAGALYAEVVEAGRVRLPGF